VRRREFITLLGGAAAWPLAASAQQQAVPVVGFLHPSSPEPFGHIVDGFRRGLNDTGFVEGQNVTIEYPGRAANTIGYRHWPLIWFNDECA
jgi:putative ABC transport system substrate-binding protein